MLPAIRLVLRGTALSRLPLMFSTKASDAPKFDPDMVKAYNKMSENHRHHDGPWGMMRDAVLSHVGFEASGLTVLDLASGPGEPAATIAAALPHCKVLATDVSEDMVAAAKHATKGLPNLSAMVADAQNLAEFQDSSVDVVTCCYGCVKHSPAVTRKCKPWAGRVRPVGLQKLGVYIGRFAVTSRL
jgi:ubiquinone/menaquinone biosynthesis C-methylase UbiE